MAEDSFDDSLCNHSLSNPKAVFNLAYKYKYSTQQVKFQFRLIARNKTYLSIQ